MNVTALVTVPLVDVLEEMGIVDDANEKAFEAICDHFDNEADGIPDEAEGCTIYCNDDELLHEALKAAKVKVKDFDAVIEKISKENNELPVFVSF